MRFPFAVYSLLIIVLIYQLIKSKVLAQFNFNIGNSVSVISGFKYSSVGFFALGN